MGYWEGIILSVFPGSKSRPPPAPPSCQGIVEIQKFPLSLPFSRLTYGNTPTMEKPPESTSWDPFPLGLGSPTQNKTSLIGLD